MGEAKPPLTNVIKIKIWKQLFSWIERSHRFELHPPNWNIRCAQAPKNFYHNTQTAYAESFFNWKGTLRVLSKPHNTFSYWLLYFKSFTTLAKSNLNHIRLPTFKFYVLSLKPTCLTNANTMLNRLRWAVKGAAPLLHTGMCGVLLLH